MDHSQLVRSNNHILRYYTLVIDGISPVMFKFYELNSIHTKLQTFRFYYGTSPIFMGKRTISTRPVLPEGMSIGISGS